MSIGNWPGIQNLRRIMQESLGQGETLDICTAADISAGVELFMSTYRRWTLYINAAAAIDVAVDISPDNGVTWYTPEDSPIVIAAPGDAIVEFGYDANRIQLTGSNASLVTAQIRGVF